MLSKNIICCALVLVASLILVASAAEELNMQEAIRMLEQLDRYYTQAARPRYGKRSVSYWGKETERPDIPAWLAYARRR